MIKVSVIIVNYNTKKLTLDCIRSVKEEGPLAKEIIVIDNGSKDGSVGEFRKLKAKLPHFVLIENEGNLGFAKAVNQGIKVARGEYILLLNSDTKLEKGSIVRMVQFANKKKKVGVVGARLLNPDGTVQGSCFHFPTIKNAVREYWLGQEGLFDKYAPESKKPQLVDAVSGAAFLITPQAKKAVGLFDERYFFYFEDIDYCRRVGRAGLRVYYLPDAHIFHYHGASGKSLADEKNQWRRLIPSSKIYHGLTKHYLLTLTLWLGQKWQKLSDS